MCSIVGPQLGAAHSVSVCLTYFVYLLKYKQISSYISNVLMHDSKQKKKSYVYILVALIEAVTLGAHAVLGAAYIYSGDYVYIDVPECVSQGIYFGSIISFDIGLVGWPVLLPKNPSPSFPDTSDTFEVLAAFGIVAACTVAFFYAKHISAAVLAAHAVLAAKYVVFDFIFWGWLKQVYRTKIKKTRIVDTVGRPLLQFV